MLKKIMISLVFILLLSSCQSPSNDLSNTTTSDTYNTAVNIINGELDGIVVLSVST